MAILPWVDISAKGRCTPLTESIVFFVEIMLTFKRVTRAALVAGIALFPCAAAYAAPQQWHCVQKNVPQKSWIESDILVIHDAETNRVLVLDGIIQHFTGAPIEASVSKSTADSLSFGWSLNTKGASAKRGVVKYSATFMTATRELRISATPLGYDNRDTARGKCSPLKRK
ncbi:hypothetical protein KM031_02695 [Gemmobacter fulvus]|uniref:Uncharacterized protein n=1 Tax=Gemmobacter fulvus TaxID=2840474 RepID=A0A975P742_9RHOB|nr:hypothetical protein [Gemmobacter fulvus]MBT9243921.1 hypothetical protein [Gemmobacter fulvus]QWK90840.1 hypothetical protein KM031_02695 [Gemmobacter fulvus]